MEPDGAAPPRDDLSTIYSEHKTVLQLCEELGEAGSTADLLPLLDQALALFGEHFQREEQPGGVFDTVSRRAPQFSAQVSDLSSEHGTMVEQARALRARISRDQREAIAAAAELARRLREHEARENEIFMEAMYQDIGVGD